MPQERISKRLLFSSIKPTEPNLPRLWSANPASLCMGSKSRLHTGNWFYWLPALRPLSKNPLQPLQLNESYKWINGIQFEILQISGKHRILNRWAKKRRRHTSPRKFMKRCALMWPVSVSLPAAWRQLLVEGWLQGSQEVLQRVILLE